MTLLQAYLSNPRTRRALSKKPGQAGFSLLELVIVVAVLAILAVIAIPAFENISADAAHAAAKNTLASILKECKVKEARGSALTYVQPASSSGVYYSSTSVGNCTTSSTNNNVTTTSGTILAACANLGTAATYTVNLITGQKNVATSIPPVAPSGNSCPTGAAGAITNW